MERRQLEYPRDYPLFSGMEEHGPKDVYADFLVQAINYDTEELLEAVEHLADAQDVDLLLQVGPAGAFKQKITVSRFLLLQPPY
jgi:hypothetical protein